MHKRRRFEAKCGDKEVGIHDINSDTSKRTAAAEWPYHKIGNE